jgi:hypothetical protein
MKLKGELGEISMSSETCLYSRAVLLEVEETPKTPDPSQER